MGSIKLFWFAIQFSLRSTDKIASVTISFDSQHIIFELNKMKILVKNGIAPGCKCWPILVFVVFSLECLRLSFWIQYCLHFLFLPISNYLALKYPKANANSSSITIFLFLEKILFYILQFLLFYQDNRDADITNNMLHYADESIN